MHILIPCKGLRTGKSRLQECLEPRARREFCEFLLNRTLETAATVVGPGRVRIVTSDPAAASIASRYSIWQIPDAGRGLNAALDGARRGLLPDMEPGEELMILPIDLPFAAAAAISSLASGASDLIIAPDEQGTGTNVLVLRTLALRHLPLAYGRNSYAAHMTAARSLGLTIQTIRDWRLAFDIDGSAQYLRWRRCEEGGRDFGSFDRPDFFGPRLA